MLARRAGADQRHRARAAEHALTIDTRSSLPDLLPEHLDLTGAKKGCDHGQCGACTIRIDGRRENGCLALAVAHDGAEIDPHINPMGAKGIGEIGIVGAAAAVASAVHDATGARVRDLPIGPDKLFSALGRCNR